MQNRRKFLTQTSLAAGAFTFLKPLQSFAGSLETGTNTCSTLTILYTTGLAEQWNKVNGRGGIGSVAEAVARIKRESQNILLVDTGNILSPDSKRSIGHLHFFREVKKTGFDVMTPGSNDLQHGADYFSRLIDASRLKTVATNYHAQGILNEDVFPHYVVRKGRLKVGIIGIGSNQVNEGNQLSSAQLINCVNRTAASLKEKHKCNLVICLSHLSLRSNGKSLDNLRLAEATSGVDMIISENDQQFTYNTHVLKNKAEHDVLVTHAGQKGTMLGRIDITVNQRGEKMALSARQVFTTTDVDLQTAFKQHAATSLA